MFKSLRWRFTIIFLTLVLVAIVIAGVYIIQFFEQYNYNLVDSRLDDLSNLILPDLEVHSDLNAKADRVEQIVLSPVGLRIREEIYVVVNNNIIASTASHLSTQANEILNIDLLLIGLNGTSERNIITYPRDGVNLRVMDKVYPIVHQGQLTGLLYLRYDLTETDGTVGRARAIIIQSVVISLIVTLILGWIISKNVTDPINDVTVKAYKMARGDFDQHVEVKSDDELGKLAEMFNHLTGRLKQSVSDISQEKSKLEAIVNNIDDGIIAMNSQRDIIHINQRAIKLLSDHHITLTNHYDSLSEQLPESMDYHHIRHKFNDLQGSELVELDHEIYRVRYESYASESDPSVGLIIVFQDVTESQRLEAMRRDFVANVSHELKTPITSIKSYAETLMDGAVDDKDTAHQFIEVINAEADRMNRLVRDLLQLSNFDAKRSRIEIADNDWCKLTQSVSQKLVVLIQARRHQLVVDIPPCPLVTEFDYNRMEQVMINLLSNAIKYTPEGGEIKVRVALDHEDVTVAVHDSGIGIAPEHLPHLFERFYRVDKGRSRELGGTGLGLSIAKEIVDYHQGTISVESQIGRGTKIYFRIPRHPDVVSSS